MVRSIIYIIATVLLMANCTAEPKTQKATEKTDSKYASNIPSAGNTEAAFTKTIPPTDFLAAFNAQPGAIMVDVRTPKEYASGRIVPDAVNVDYHSDGFLENILELSKDEPIYIYCFSGGRSSKAAYKMRQLGFDRVYECEGGYQRWKRENQAE